MTTRLDFEAKKISEVITENFTDSLQNFYEYHKSYDFAFDYAPQLGEADGIAGIITALSLLKRYSPHSQLEDTIRDFLFKIVALGLTIRPYISFFQNKQF
ncbi:MAG: hypothetical protein IJ257_01585 [Treponema sp.]|nr:hypothetical protein [Treponema sp.]